MPETSCPINSTTVSRTGWTDLVAVCRRIPPLWDLRNYVAVNPFLGFTSMRMDVATRIMEVGLGAKVLPSLDFYRQRWAAGDFGPHDLPPGPVRDLIEGDLPCAWRHISAPLTFSEYHDQVHGTDWRMAIQASVARWCAVYASGGGTFWSLPDEHGLYESWREAASVDPNLEIAGLRGWRTWVQRLPEHPEDALGYLLGLLPIATEHRQAYLYRLLGTLFGWASYFRREAWLSGDEPGAIGDLLVILLACDIAVIKLGKLLKPKPPLIRVEDEAIRLTLQDALEDGFARRLFSKFAPPPESETTNRPDVQAVFCIDVRSEVLRRHLEAQSPDIETRGFAGFFGVALEWDSSARCPVLLRPGVSLRSSCHTAQALVSPAMKKAQAAPASSFSLVEVLGPIYGVRLVSDAFVTNGNNHSVDGREAFTLESLANPSRIQLAAGILKGMAFLKSFARLILLCGHESHSENNPHASGLDCGACGGHSGAINARVAAAILNDPDVRSGLIKLGWRIPNDTHFLPAVHNTATDNVELLDLDRVPVDHRTDVERLRSNLAQAAEKVRWERAMALGLTGQTDGLEKSLKRRERDWSEVRPEWGLARNAAFIAARRSRTRGVNLEGRVFLHEYDADTDPDDAVLTLILTAPVIVASWINLQYFASTVDNEVFGAGTKTLHNRVGDIGVVLGNGGDLRTGLAAQSVHSPDGSWYHEPLRLQVIVESTPERIDGILAAHPEVRCLVENGWIRLFALAPTGNAVFRNLPTGAWQIVEPTHDSHIV